MSGSVLLDTPMSDPNSSVQCQVPSAASRPAASPGPAGAAASPLAVHPAAGDDREGRTRVRPGARRRTGPRGTGVLRVCGVCRCSVSSVCCTRMCVPRACHAAWSLPTGGRDQTPDHLL